ncbi:MAG: C39 family peptidase [Anaerolineales bacterium]|nr:C39 family peptidase [Anaerolineales bacterium]
MRLAPTLTGVPGGDMQSLSKKIVPFFTSGPVLYGVNVLILVGFLTYFFLNQQPEPIVVAAAVPRTSAVQATPVVNTLVPQLTHTAFTPSPRTPSPTLLPAIIYSPTPTPTPTVESILPESASIEGIVGHSQSMPLSCESRSAVDWASYFGKSINEYKFFNGLPVNDNPDKGFVGDVNGSWGQIPPFSYGVHAKPVAQRLREFGLNAKSVRNMSWVELQTEIAAGRPVIVWVVGHVNLGTPIPYTTSGGALTTVARFQHTVIVIGYTENKITFLDGFKIYARYKGEFMKSWGVLENQAVIWID